MSSQLAGDIMEHVGIDRLAIALRWNEGAYAPVCGVQWRGVDLYHEYEDLIKILGNHFLKKEIERHKFILVYRIATLRVCIYREATVTAAFDLGCQ